MTADCCKFDGTLTAAEFRVAARELCMRREQESPHLPRWTWIPSPSSEVEGYLSSETFYSPQQKEEITDEEHNSEQEEAGIDDGDEATLVMEVSQTTHSYEFHIVYCFSYKVPVLYFRGYKCDGTLLNLKMMEADLPFYSSVALRESKWTFITQEEHPFLHRPWYELHPCGTADWMKLLLGGCSGSGQYSTESRDVIIRQYLSSWLSVVGQTIGLRVPLKLYSNSIHYCMPVTDFKCI